MDDRRLRAWRALGLGPVWTARAPAAGDAEPGAGVDPDEAGPAGADPAGADPRSAVAVAAVPDAIECGEAASARADPASARADPAIEREGEDVDVAVSRAPAERREPAIAALRWPMLRRAVEACGACDLCESRRNAVFGVGPSPAAWLLVGEAPGEQEDLRGEPFVGPAGRLLDEMLHAIGVDRAGEAFIANVLKCRPPGNRNPTPHEVSRCEPYLLRQVALLRPRTIVVLGRFAAQSLLRTDASIASLRGRVHRYRAGEVETPLVVTYHPAYLLRTLPDKAKAWADLRLARRTFDAAWR